MSKTKTEPELFGGDAPVQVREGTTKSNTKERPTTKRPPAPKAQTAQHAKKGEVVPFKPEPPSLLVAIMSAAADPEVQPEKMNVLNDLRVRLMKEEAEVGYWLAYREISKKLPIINKDNKIEITPREGARSRAKQETPYAGFENIMRVIKPLLEECKLDLSLHSEPAPGGIGIQIRATLTYVAVTQYGGCIHQEFSLVPMPPDPTGSKNAAQAISSALAYAKRNAIILVLNIVSSAKIDQDLDGHNPDNVAKVAKVGDARPLISPQQADEALKKINDCEIPSGTVQKKFKSIGIEKIHDMPLDQYQLFLQACDNYKQERDRLVAAGKNKG